MSQGKKLFVGVPVYGQVNWEFHQCMNLLHKVNGQDGIIIAEQPGDSLVCRARNALTRKFLESDATHLLWIDSDLVFSPEHIVTLMKREEDVVGGAYFKKSEGPPLGVWNLIPGQQANAESDLVEVLYIGTGFMRISRRVFELMIQKFGSEIWYTLDHDRKQKEYDFWRVGVYEYPDKTRRYLSEDWWFCQKWRDIGGKVWLDRSVTLKHMGQAAYPLSYQEQTIFKRPGASVVAPGPLAEPAGIPLSAGELSVA